MNAVMYNDLLFEKEMSEVLKREDLSDEEREQIENAIIQNFCSSIEKTGDLLKFRANLLGMKSMFKAEEERLATQRKNAERITERIETGIETYMKAKGLDSIKAGTFNLSLRASTAVELDNIDSVPEEFVNVTIEKKLDKMAVKAALKSNPDLEQAGFHIEHRKNLQIK